MLRWDASSALSRSCSSLPLAGGQVRRCVRRPSAAGALADAFAAALCSNIALSLDALPRGGLSCSEGLGGWSGSCTAKAVGPAAKVSARRASPSAAAAPEASCGCALEFAAAPPSGFVSLLKRTAIALAVPVGPSSSAPCWHVQDTGASAHLPSATRDGVGADCTRPRRTPSALAPGEEPDLTSTPLLISCCSRLSSSACS
mmetsp:Transcript_23061/g.61545  ORF Transcript_23061/g.61545 Transcript_23061/m.61545 type:complete len:201 (+) Transcript_23061:117-719(+)